MTFSPTRPLHRFQSTPSARRATAGGAFQDPGRVQISIHALREEGDRQRCCKVQRFLHFNPRPPRGGRHFELVHPQSQSKFQSTPSARRATSPLRDLCARRTGISIHALREEGDDGGRGNAAASTNFNPRPPRGGRLRSFVLSSLP